MRKLVILFMWSLILNSYSCSRQNIDHSYPKSREDEEYERIGSLINDSDSGIEILSLGKKETVSNNGVKINNIAWQAALETVKFMPLISTDASGGVIITDWYQEPNNISERYKLAVFVQGANLTGSSVKVTTYRQVKKGSDWISIEASPKLSEEIEEKILLKAKNIKRQGVKLIKN